MPPTEGSTRSCRTKFNCSGARISLDALLQAMSEKNLLLIAELPGFTPQIGRLVSMMNYVRSTTLSAVAGLCGGELAYLPELPSKSNGAGPPAIAAPDIGDRA